MDRMICIALAVAFAVIGLSVAQHEVSDVAVVYAYEETARQEIVSDEPAAEEMVIEEPQGRLAGLVIGIDPGHQGKGNSEKEAVAPGSSEMKAKVSSGTQGVSTRIPEYQVNLEVALMLRDALVSEGAEVVMTRETNDVDISNQERAILCNEAGCDLVLRIHCNGSENRSVTGMGMYVRATGACAEESYHAGECLIDTMSRKTGAKAQGIFKSDTYTGLNWSEVPCVMVEMGYMSNAEEDEKLCDSDYQALLVEGMVEGICNYFER